MILETKDLRKDYKNNDGVFGIDIKITKNIVYGLIGPNGAGKTTTLGMLTTLIKPTGGDAFIDGKSVVHETDKVKDIIGFLPHETQFYINKTMLKSLIFYARLSGYDKIEAEKKSMETIEKLGLLGNENKKISELSNGMKKLLGIAQAIIHKPKIVILDEPFTGLDAKTRIIMRNVINLLKKDTTIILSSHNLDEVEKLCDRIGIIKNGKIVIDDDVKKLKLVKHQITLEFTDIDKKIIAKLKKMKNVDKVVQNENQVILTFKHQDDNLNYVTTYLNKADINPISIKKGNTIEDIFIEVS